MAGEERSDLRVEHRLNPCEQQLSEGAAEGISHGDNKDGDAVDCPVVGLGVLWRRSSDAALHHRDDADQQLLAHRSSGVWDRTET